MTEEPTKVAFFNLREHHCRWMFGDGLDALFCGCRVNPDSKFRYCAAHIEVVLQPRTKARDREDRGLQRLAAR